MKTILSVCAGVAQSAPTITSVRSGLRRCAVFAACLLLVNAPYLYAGFGNFLEKVGNFGEDAIRAAGKAADAVGNAGEDAIRAAGKAADAVGNVGEDAIRGVGTALNAVKDFPEKLANETIGKVQKDVAKILNELRITPPTPLEITVQRIAEPDIELIVNTVSTNFMQDLLAETLLGQKIPIDDSGAANYVRFDNASVLLGVRRTNAITVEVYGGVVEHQGHGRFEIGYSSVDVVPKLEQRGSNLVVVLHARVMSLWPKAANSTGIMQLAYQIALTRINERLDKEPLAELPVGGLLPVIKNRTIAEMVVYPAGGKLYLQVKYAPRKVIEVAAADGK